MNNSAPLGPQFSEKENKLIIAGIGASAGGIQALKFFFENVTENSGIAYVVILHLSPDHDSKLAEVLQIVSKIPVVQVNEKIKVVPNTIYVVPPNQHLSMSDGWVVVSPNMKVEDRRAPVDIFFRTLAESHGSRAICIVLSGTGANGSMGLKRVKEMGGAAIVQSPEEAEFNEMPRNAISTDLVDAVLPIAEIPAFIINYKNNLGSVSIPVEPEQRREDQQIALREIFSQLRTLTGHDFSNYKRSTLLRRIERRITVRSLPDLASYNAFLKEHPEETHALLKDLLISVTNFFRDRKTFDALETEIIPLITKSKNAEQQVRIWVAGCATGEEAYSIAMLCVEQVVDTLDAPRIQIFATDIDEDAISYAREGFYTINDAADVSPERLRRFFNKEGEGYRIKRELRELVLFANHNFIKDPPFSRLDLVSCRNVLIYLNRLAQQRAMETFHFALNTGGYLFLGTSESIDPALNLYDIYNREQHIFKSKQVAVRTYPVPDAVPVIRTDHLAGTINKEKSRRYANRISFGELHQRILEQYAPPSLIIDEEYEIVHLTEGVSSYLHFSGGEPSQSLLKVINPQLRLELRSALYQAREQNTAVKLKDLKVQVDNQLETVTIHIRPVLHDQDIGKGYILIIFEKTGETGNDHEVAIRSDHAVSRQLEDELMRFKSELLAANAYHEFQAEELKANNEELQAMNEEMRSATEELETSREELQSINEELRTVNQELKIKIEETTLNSNNLRNLINSAYIGTIFLDRSLRIAMFTPAVLELFNLIPGDFGRPLSDITHHLKYNDLLVDAEKVMEKLSPIEREVRSTDNRIYIMRLLPYRTAEDLINGVVITFVDITRRVHSEEALLEREAELRNFITATFDGVYKMNADWSEMKDLKGMPFAGPDKTDSKGWLDKFVPEEEKGKVLAAIHQAIQTKSIFELEHKVLADNGTTGWTLNRAVPVLNSQKEITGWIGAASDITARRQYEEELRRSEERFRLISESGLLLIAFFNSNGIITDANNAFLDAFGYSRKQLLEGIVNWDLLTPENWKDKTRQAILKFNETGIFTTFEKEFIRRDGSIAWGLFGGARFAGKEEGLSFILDITELKALERHKDGLIGIASHELKTPVTSIKVYCDILKEKFENAGDQSNRDIISKMSQQVDRLARLINDLLDATKVAEGVFPINRTRFDINELIREKIEELQHLSSTCKLVFKPGNLDLLYADKESIGRVVTNLVHNAIKYSPEGETVLIMSEKTEGGIKVSVRDNGIGIPEKFLQNVFDRFFRISNPQTKTFPGIGLGLYISANIVRQHGGKLSVESKENDGSLFYFVLPYSNDK